MRKGAGFHISTAMIIIMLLAFRCTWMPYIGSLTMEWPFYFVRWAFYAMVIGAVNLFFYMTLTNFSMGFVPGFLIPLGIRIGLDAAIYLLAALTGEFIFTVRYVLDALFIVLAGLSITWTDRKRKKWEPGKAGRASRIALALLMALLLALVIIVQADVIKITDKYVKDSDGYNASMGYVAIKAHLLSLGISFAVQYVMVLFLIHKKQGVRVRPRGVINGIVLFGLLGMVTQLRWIAAPAYFSDTGSAGNGHYIEEDEKEPAAKFHVNSFHATFEWRNQALERIEEGSLEKRQIYNKDYTKSISFNPSQDWYSNELMVNGHKVFYYSPYALFYFDGEDQQLLLVSDILKKPKNGMLIDILKQGILDGDFHCFEYGGAYLAKYDPDFIQPLALRYGKGEFTDQERKDMGDIRPDFVQELARKLEVIQTP